MHDTVCVGPADQLPYDLTTNGDWAEITYKWNPHVVVDVPNPVSERPKGFITALPDL